MIAKRPQLQCKWQERRPSLFKDLRERPQKPSLCSWTMRSRVLRWCQVHLTDLNCDWKGGNCEAWSQAASVYHCWNIQQASSKQTKPRLMREDSPRWALVPRPGLAQNSGPGAQGLLLPLWASASHLPAPPVWPCRWLSALCTRRTLCWGEAADGRLGAKSHGDLHY